MGILYWKRRTGQVVAIVVAVSLLAAACSTGSETPESASPDLTTETSATEPEDTAGVDGEVGGVTDPADDSPGDREASGNSELAAGQFNAPGTFGDPPPIPADYDPALDEALDAVFGPGLPTASFAGADRAALETIEASGDPRMAWYMADLIRFFGTSQDSLIDAAESLTGLTLTPFSSWGDLTDHLIAWDIPAPPNYTQYKRAMFSEVEPKWASFFEDESDVDYRHWSWGGVGIDDRPFDQTDVPCDCIPAADNPVVTDAAGGDWYDDDRFIFGVVINGEARAYPRNIMEIREMVNDTLGGRNIAMPYCTLCGSAQVYFADQLPSGVERPVMRTSGLLSRSNKVMYEVNTFSVFDTFLGTAVTGPLAAAGLELEQASVITTTWGEWKAEYPETTILDESLRLGRQSDLLQTRDAGGPIFPIGDVDPRLPVQEPVLGAVTGNGQPVAFPVALARTTLADGDAVVFQDVHLQLFAGGVRAADADGNDLGGHQAFWFAWSQFYPDTAVWGGG